MRPLRFSLVLLGPPHVWDNHTGTVVAFPAKGFELAAFLSLQHGDKPARRDAVAQFLWPDGERGRAIVNLRSLLARIRRIRDGSGADFVTETRESVRLTVPTVVDVARLGVLATDDCASSVLEQCALYRGDLLEGLGGVTGDWLMSRRAALRGAFVGSVTRYLEKADPGREAAAIETAALRLFAVDPYLEAPYRALMRLHAAAGRLRELERVYRDCCERFETELGTAPSPGFTGLYRGLCELDSDDGRGNAKVVTVVPRPAEPVPSRAPQQPGLVHGLPSVCVLMPPALPDRGKFDLVTALLEDVTIGLCAQRTFAVIAPYTAWQMGPDGTDGGFVKEFGIGYVLLSRTLQSGSDWFLTPRLLEARSRRIIWADRFALDETDFNAAYDRLSWRIARSLAEAVENAELDRHRRVAEPSAYVAYLLGTRALAKVQLPNIRAARRLFRSSLKQDDGFAPAFGALARTLVMEWLLLARGEVDLLDEAEQYARRALALDPEQVDGLRELGLCNLYRGRFDDSLFAFTEAERRAPQHADLIADHADALSLAGMSVEALGKMQRASALNPLGPDRYRWYEGTILYQLEQYEAAISAISRMTDASPAYKLLAASWAMLGDKARARDYARKVLRIYPDFSVGKWLSMIPIRNAAVRERYEEGLRAAGFR